MSLPGFPFFESLLALALILLTGAVWFARLIGTIVVQSRGQDRMQLAVSRWYLVAPVLGVVVIGLAASSVPLKLRWAIGESQFATIVAKAPPATSDWQDFDVPNRIGTYKIEGAARIPQGVLFYEAHGALFDQAGFAYLPDGPSPDLENGLFESPAFESLGGHWYAWVASW